MPTASAVRNQGTFSVSTFASGWNRTMGTIIMNTIIPMMKGDTSYKTKHERMWIFLSELADCICPFSACVRGTVSSGAKEEFRRLYR